MKKILIMTMILLMILTSCKKKEEVTLKEEEEVIEKEEEVMEIEDNTTIEDIYDKAIGILVTTKAEELEKTIIYASMDEFDYKFENMDVAMAFYYDINNYSSIAGFQKVNEFDFNTDDNDDHYLMARASYKESSNNKSNITAYYLYYDKDGLYFDASKPFKTEILNEDLIIKGEEYNGEISFMILDPVNYFTMAFYDEDENLLDEIKYKPEEIDAYQQIEVLENTTTIKYTTYNKNNTIIETKELTNNDYTLDIFYDDGGELLNIITLRLLWPEDNIE